VRQVGHQLDDISNKHIIEESVRQLGHLPELRFVVSVTYIHGAFCYIC
jgi:hypothetical protein